MYIIPSMQSCRFITAMIRRYMIMKMYAQRSRHIFVDQCAIQCGKFLSKRKTRFGRVDDERHKRRKDGRSLPQARG